MSHDLPKRLTALLGAFIFLLNMAGEGFGYTACPFDGGGGNHSAHHSAPAEPQRQGGSTGGDHGHPEHSGHHHPAGVLVGESAVHAHVDPTTSENGSEPCTHMELCQAATGSVLPVDIEAPTVAAALTTLAPRAVPVERIAASHTPFFLPYSQAPPARG